MRIGVIVFASMLALAACKPSEPKPKPTPTPTASALYPRPICTGTPSAIHKRICANKSLDWLDRVLQKQWAAARTGAGADKLKELDAAQAKLLAERAACADDMCVAKVYKKYIGNAAKPVAKPKPKPAKKPWVRKPPAKKPPVARPAPRPAPTSRPDRPRGPSCASQIGAAAAQRLASQCDRVNPSRLCSTDRSCRSLRRNIRRGCNTTYRKPGFCAGL